MSIKLFIASHGESSTRDLQEVKGICQIIANSKDNQNAGLEHIVLLVSAKAGETFIIAGDKAQAAGWKDALPLIPQSLIERIDAIDKQYLNNDDIKDLASKGDLDVVLDAVKELEEKPAQDTQQETSSDIDYAEVTKRVAELNSSNETQEVATNEEPQPTLDKEEIISEITKNITASLPTQQASLSKDDVVAIATIAAEKAMKNIDLKIEELAKQIASNSSVSEVEEVTATYEIAEPPMDMALDPSAFPPTA